MPNKALTFEEDFKEQIVFRIQENSSRIEKCLSLLSEEEVWLQSGPETNSIANLILHLCGNIGQYIISSLGEKKDFRHRELEFSSRKGFTKNELYEKMETTCSAAIKVINGSSMEKLQKVRSVQGFKMTGLAACIHVAEHYSYHTGQIALLTKLFSKKDLGFYADFDLDLKNE